MKISCPECKSKAGIRKIIFGMPMGPVDPDKFVLGGCCILLPEPDYECITCSWQHFPPGAFDELSELVGNPESVVELPQE